MSPFFAKSLHIVNDNVPGFMLSHFKIISQTLFEEFGNKFQNKLCLKNVNEIYLKLVPVPISLVILKGEKNKQCIYILWCFDHFRVIPVILINSITIYFPRVNFRRGICTRITDRGSSGDSVGLKASVGPYPLFASQP